MLRLAGDDDLRGTPGRSSTLETALARLQWTKVAEPRSGQDLQQGRVRQAARLAPGFDWKAYLSDSGVAGKIDYLVIQQPSYSAGFSTLLASTPLSVWKELFPLAPAQRRLAVPEQALRR